MTCDSSSFGIGGTYPPCRGKSPNAFTWAALGTRDGCTHVRGYEPLLTFDESNAAVYADLVDRGDEAETVEVLYDLAGGAGRRAMELAIGTGRIALPLAAKGVRVDGIDLSAPMV